MAPQQAVTDYMECPAPGMCIELSTRLTTLEAHQEDRKNATAMIFAVLLSLLAIGIVQAVSTVWWASRIQLSVEMLVETSKKRDIEMVEIQRKINFYGTRSDNGRN